MCSLQERLLPSFILIVSARANCVIESLLLKKDGAKSVNDFLFVTTNFILRL